MLDRFADMAIFAAVMDTGSFTRAAQQLELSKSAVSKAVARLETELQTKLLVRTTRKLSPTVAGSDFYQHCREIVQEADLAYEHIGAMRTTPSGRVTLTAPVNYGATRIAPLIPHLLATYPQLDVDLQLTNRLVDLVGEKVDIAIRCGVLKDSSFYFRRVAPLSIVLAGSKGYFASHAKPKHPHELSYKFGLHQCITDSAKAADKLWRFYEDDQLIQVTVNGRFAVSDNRAMRAALLADLGLAYMPSYSLNEMIAAGQIETALDDFMPQPVPVHLLYPERKYTTAAVTVVLDYLQQQLSQ
ncbi:LysR family transcriptional regulator [Pseudidiomarina terrestris]|uniref:LysR family transcriptional regulator n=1 Tax=Pseudidiomarina terrestris TaxID=2820060 RepID=A0AAW7R0D1_9GAMM|nr:MULTISPECIES: LysR family transcriptional regulator [unclassified Pseudidiomarina]MDN7124009.1 LysR family transcriptional regulator [Pseudidiomarina sp. 1APP75-32.1]MDN7127073.1 LysR family transcriptional regulator [Pseudidiomarina sp. 1APR75-33.1]MDN7128266.1 LysR family transcriptional regulator [Pseudidiomarina sp. 1APR75-15]MDN7135510.1 LysR family transcriptional regulator [Pseudidiomarina sp. 1ASP75-5]MDN7138993.1 LysR family transcriptional regulator [Pseudidiomarina sp. 1ASP75-14]